MTTITTTAPSQVNAAIRAYLVDLGFVAHPHGIYRRTIRTIRQNGAARPTGYLQVEVSVTSTRTTRLGIERWHCSDAPARADDWLKANIWPAVYRYARRPPRRGTLLPTGGSFTTAAVLTAEALDVVKMWVPQEITWQEASTTTPLASSPERPQNRSQQ